MTTPQLPPLPEPYCVHHRYDGSGSTNYFSADKCEAMALSAKRRINITHSDYGVTAWTDENEPVQVHEFTLFYDESGRELAMCVAITRAAANIGRGEG